MKKLIYINGLPNSGKTTFSKNLNPCLHLDDYTTGKKTCICYDILELFKSYNLVYIEGLICVAALRRAILIPLKLRLNIKIIGVFLNTDYTRCCERNIRYTQEWMDEIKDNFQPMTRKEGYDIIYEIRLQNHWRPQPRQIYK